MVIRKILFPTDFSRCSQQALEYALIMTKLYRSELHVVHVAVPPGYSPEATPTSEVLPEQQLNAGLASVRSLLSTNGDAKCSVTGTVLYGTIVPQVILEYASEHDIDLIIMGTHGRQGVEHLLLGSVAETVVRHALCPVITLRSGKHVTSVRTPERILIPIDLSEHSELALTYGKYLAADCNAHLQVLHVVEEDFHPAFYAMGQSPVTLMMADILLRARAETERLLQRAPGPPVSAETVVVQGYPPAMIIRMAQELKSDFIVIATHGLTGIEHFLLGSVTEKVVRTSPVPVFTVKSFGKKLLPSGEAYQSSQTNEV